MTVSEPTVSHVVMSGSARARDDDDDDDDDDPTRL